MNIDMQKNLNKTQQVKSSSPLQKLKKNHVLVHFIPGKEVGFTNEKMKDCNSTDSQMKKTSELLSVGRRKAEEQYSRMGLTVKNHSAQNRYTTEILYSTEKYNHYFVMHLNEVYIEYYVVLLKLIL